MPLVTMTWLWQEHGRQGRPHKGPPLRPPQQLQGLPVGLHVSQSLPPSASSLPLLQRHVVAPASSAVSSSCYFQRLCPRPPPGYHSLQERCLKTRSTCPPTHTPCTPCVKPVAQTMQFKLLSMGAGLSVSRALLMLQPHP